VDTADLSLNPANLTASAVQGIVSGNITVTLGSTGSGVEIGIPTGQQADFAPGDFDAVESARLDYIAFALQNLEGGTTSTRIRQTNGAFKLYSGSSSYHEYVGSPPPAVLTPGDFYEYSNGNIVKERLYVFPGDFTAGTYTLNANGILFDFNILIAKNTGPVTLEITPDDDPTRKYTVTITHSGVTFKGGSLPSGTAPDYVAAPTSDTNYNNYTGGVTVSVPSLTKQANTDNYTAEVESSGPIGGGLAGGGAGALPGDTTTAGHPYTDMGAVLWQGAANIAKTNVITLNFYTKSGGTGGDAEILSDWGSGNITIRQVNPAFVVYEDHLSTGGSWVPEMTPGADNAGHYSNDPSFKWSGDASAGGHILYKEKATYAYSATDLDNFNILIMDGAQPEEVIFTFTYTNGSSQVVTKGLKLDYSDVIF
jgi:hypothetical protein